MKYCSKCLYGDDHPLGIEFDENDICSGCLIHEEKNSINWKDRWIELEKLISSYRSKNKSNYDCIVPVSGSSESYYILDIVKNKLKMKPLLVSYNKYFNTPLGIRNLSNLRIKFDSDILIQNVNPLSVKKITKTTLGKLGSMYWPCIAGSTAFPVQTAARYKIPLIIWGAHQGIEQVGMYSHLNNVEMTRRYRKVHDLMGYEADDLLSTFDSLSEEHIWQYRYPSDQNINEVGIRGIYLGNYIRWDPKNQYEEMISSFEYKTSNFSRTFNCYDHVDCFNYMDVHDYIKYIKHGFSKVTDHASREIRHGRINREEGIKLVNKYQSKDTKYLDLFLEWLDLDKDSFNFVIDQFRNKKYWQEIEPKKWKRINKIDDKSSIEKEINKLNYISNSSLEMDLPKKYITVGKGYP